MGKLNGPVENHNRSIIKGWFQWLEWWWGKWTWREWGDFWADELPIWGFITGNDQTPGVEERTVQSETLVVAALWGDKWVAVFQFWSYDEILDGFHQYPLTAKSVQHIISSIEPERWDSAEITDKKKLVWVTLVNTIIKWLEKNDRTHKLFLQELHLLPKIILQYFKKKVKEHGITLTEDDMEILDM